MGQSRQVMGVCRGPHSYQGMKKRSNASQAGDWVRNHAGAGSVLLFLWLVLPLEGPVGGCCMPASQLSE